MYPLMLVEVMVMMSVIARSGKRAGAPRARPALLIRMSMCDMDGRRLVMAVERAEWSWTSTGVVKIFRFGVVVLRSEARVWSLEEERAKRMRITCSLARRRAMEAPMPDDAPVIRTVCSLRDILGRC